MSILATQLPRTWDTRPGLLGWLGAVNHKQIGKRYLVTAMAFFVIGGIQAVLLRAQLGTPESSLLSPEVYNQLFTMHGTTMMFLFAVPVTEAFAIYLAPLMVGARDMPLPRLNAMGYWIYLFGGIFVYASFATGHVPDGGWFAYPPLTGPEARPGLNLDFWLLGVTFIEIAGIVAAIELAILVFRTRAPGMTLNRIPLFVWGSMTTAIMVIFAFPPLVVASLMLELDRKALTVFYDPVAGDPILWQHLFWWFGHPEVYIILLPSIGMVSMIIPTFARTRILGYPLIVAATVAIGIVSFGLWAHHMYATGLPTAALAFFTAGSLAIAIPSGIQVFAWIGTMWKGRIRWELPMYWVVSFLVTFTMGGLTGVMVAVVPFDWQAHDTYFVVAHFHYVIIGGVVFPLLGGFHYWLPKITGRLPSRRWGLVGFWTTTVAFHVTFFVQHIVGLIGMPRRVWTFPAGIGWEPYNLVSTVGAFALATGFTITLATLLAGIWRGPAAGPNPWEAGTLEWATTSPPPPHNFDHLAFVTSTDPLWDGVDVFDPPQEHRAFADSFNEPSATRRRIAVTTMLDAAPEHLTTLPAHSLWPLGTALAMSVALLGVLVDGVPLGVVGAIGTVVCLFGWGWSRQDAEREPAADVHTQDERA
jgi:cytochrome c oxidase subunit I+III